MEKEKKFRKLSLIMAWLTINGAKEHKLIFDRDNYLHAIISRNDKLITKSRYFQLGGEYNNFTIQHAKEFLDFINQ